MTTAWGALGMQMVTLSPGFMPMAVRDFAHCRISSRKVL